MAGQQQFNPGVSLAGAVDLEALKHQVKAEPGQAGGAPAAGGYVIDTTENTFQAMVQTSTTFPILLFLWVPTDDRLFPMARKLADAVNAMNGQIQMSRIDIATNPNIAQALQVQGAPAMFALIGGRPMPLLQGLPSDEEMQQITEQVLPKIVAMAQQAGVNGTAPYSGDPDADGAQDEGAANPASVVPPEHQEAYQLAQAGDYAGAAAASRKCSKPIRTMHSPHASVPRRCCWRVRRPLTCARYARPPQIVPMTSKRSWPWRMWT